MASFEEILNKPASEIKAPQALPVGTYHCLIDGPPTVGKSSRVQTDMFTYKFKILAAGKDVDPQQAAEQQVVGKVFTSDYYITDSAAYRLREMLVDSCGIDDNNGKKSLKELIAESPGQQLLVTLKHDPSADGKRTFHKVHATAHV